MTDYKYVKTTVDLVRLGLEIQANAGITKVYAGGTWDSPDKLTVSFEEELSPSEKTLLDGIVVAHTGAPVDYYNVYCSNCDKDYQYPSLAEPTQCPVCGSTDIKVTKV